MHSMRRVGGVVAVWFAVIGAVALLAAPAFSHCDSLDGPVVTAARAALDTGDVNRVLIWVREDDEAEIRRAFDHTLKVRKLGAQARELADTFFFETLVRVHRAGEGAPYTGLKPAGRDLGPAIPGADKALASGDIGPLADLLAEQVRAGLRERFKETLAARDYKTRDVRAGREYVEKYVTFIHYVEGVYEAATRPVEGHYPEEGGGVHEEL